VRPKVGEFTRENPFGQSFSARRNRRSRNDREMVQALAASIARHVQAQNLARRAFDRHLERTAAHLAVRREPLVRHARVNDEVEALAAKRALDRFRDFHFQY
jgi:hypothetical protein